MGARRRAEGGQRGRSGIAAGADEVFDLMSLLWELYHHLHATSKRMQARFGVTGPQRLAIRVVGLSPGLSAGELARILHLHPSTLTGVLRRLEERGILRRTTHPRDARRAVLHLTSRGRSKDGFRAGTVEHAVVAALDRTSGEDLAAARRVLRQLVASLAEEGARAAGAVGATRAGPGP